MDANLINTAFQEEIRKKTFSGAQVLLGKGKEQIFGNAYGTVRGDPRSRPITALSLFDVASLTKPFATTFLLMLAVQERVLDLQDPVQKFLPGFRRKERLSVQQLLEHSSGLPAWLPIFEELKGQNLSYDQTVDHYIQRIDEAPLLQTPGEKRIYSDLGFILLGFILEATHGLRISTSFANLVVERLALSQLTFNPLQHPSLNDIHSIAATEACPWRGKVLQGEVHDDNAYVLGGAAGHAGLFSNAADLRKIVLLLLETYAGVETILSKDILHRFVGADLNFKLGWDTVSPSGSQAGSKFSEKNSIGHLAFTGCSVWIDFSDQKFVILLTNRVHPSRHEESAFKEFRPRIHDSLIGEMGKKEP